MLQQAVVFGAEVDQGCPQAVAQVSPCVSRSWGMQYVVAGGQPVVPTGVLALAVCPAVRQASAPPFPLIAQRQETNAAWLDHGREKAALCLAAAVERKP